MICFHGVTDLTIAVRKDDDGLSWVCIVCSECGAEHGEPSLLFDLINDATGLGTNYN